VNEVDELRREIAARHGIPEAGVSFILGQTVEQLEASASRLAGLVAARDEQEPEQTDPLTHALGLGSAAKAKRNAALVGLLHGPPQQPRDRLGRYTGKQSAGFDGGARPLVREADPERDHDQLIAEMALASKAYGTTFTAGSL
jgi:hypothetical protein